MPTDIDTILTEIHGLKAFAQERVKEGITPLKEEYDRMALTMKDIMIKLIDIQRAKLANVSDEGVMRVPTGRLAGFTFLDLKILEALLKNRQAKELSHRTLPLIYEGRKALKGYISPESILSWEDNCHRRRMVAAFGDTPKRVAVPFRDTLANWTRQMIDEQTKALDSTTATAGDELVPTFEAAELWMDVNLDTLVLPLLPQIPMPSNPFDMPRQLGDTNWYPATENVQVTGTTPSTGKSTLTAYGLKTGVPFSDEIEEDAIIALVPEIRRSLVRNAAEIMDDILLNADTTVLNNINADGTTIATSTAGKAQWLLGFDGLIHLALVDNSANQSTDVAGGVTADVYNAILTKLGRHAVPRRRGEVVYITDVNCATRSLSIPELETVDTAGERATMSTGEIMNIYGKPLIQSEQMLRADTDGKVTSAGNATNTSRVLVLNTTQWRVGFRRQITVETDREPGKGQTTMYVSFRIALTERTGTRSTATHTGVSYNITGT